MPDSSFYSLPPYSLNISSFLISSENSSSSDNDFAITSAVFFRFRIRSRVIAIEFLYNDPSDEFFYDAHRIIPPFFPCLGVMAAEGVIPII